MTPIQYQVVGEEDYAIDIQINADGELHMSNGTYTSDKPRTGHISAEQQQHLLEAIKNLGRPEDHPMPEGAADAFKAHLIIGEGESALRYDFWEGALEEDSKLLALIRTLENL